MARRTTRTRPPDADALASGEPREAAYDVEVLRVFLEYGRDIAAWHRARGEGHERRAASTIGFAGAILALMGGLIEPLRGTNGAPEAVATAFASVGAVLLLASAALASLALSPRQVDVIDPDWLADQFERYIAECHLDLSQVTGAFARSWAGRPGKAPHSVLRNVAANATRRGLLVRRAGWLLLGGVGSIAVTVLVIIFWAG